MLLYLSLLKLELYQEETATFTTNKIEINGLHNFQLHTDSINYNEKIGNDSLTSYDNLEDSYDMLFILFTLSGEEKRDSKWWLGFNCLFNKMKFVFIG